MINRKWQILYLGIIILTLASCRGTKVLQEDQRLYTGATLHFKDNDNLEKKRTTTSELEELLQPSPNTTLAGMRPPLWIYYITRNPKKEKGLKNWLRDKFGEEPVLTEDINANNTQQLLQKKLHNEGYFANEVNYEWDLNKQTGNIKYNILLNEPYHFKKIEYPDSVNKLTGFINRSKVNSLVKPTHRYELQRLTKERKRIEGFLRDRGYYYFSENNLIFEIDTTIGNNQAEAQLRLKEKILSRAKEQFKINKITVTPIYNANDTKRIINDTLLYDDIHFFDPRDDYNPDIIINNINLKPGDLYSHTKHDRTINKLIGLNVFRYVNATYKETDKPGMLNAEYKLFPYKKKSIRFELKGISKSTNYIGPFFNAIYQNRNFLKGAELFQLSINTGFEALPGNIDQNSYEIGVQSSLTVPKFITPFNIKNESSRFIPNTIFQTGIMYKSRADLYTMRSINLGVGYKWNETLYKNHEFYPMRINLVDIIQSTQAFEDTLDSNPYLRQSYAEQFIFGGRYSYTYNTQAVKDRNKSTDLFFKTNVDLSGNMAYLIQKYLGGNGNERGETYNIFGSQYSQFSKVDFDVRFYYQIDRNNRLATRLITGLGYAYGNSESLPYVNQFSIGGSSSLRAFPARSLGPGSYPGPYTDKHATKNQFIDQTGDIKFEWNLEYRFNIIGSLKGAVFADVGNIWTMDSTRAGSQFKLENFLNELAIGTGIGLRYDVSYFVIRFDVGIPVRVPSNPDLADPENENSLWVFDDVFRRNDSWGGNEFVYNIAIGYPF